MRKSYSPEICWSTRAALRADAKGQNIGVCKDAFGDSRNNQNHRCHRTLGDSRGNRRVDGVPGNACWPVEPGVSLCAGEGSFPWQNLDLSVIPVTAGDTIVVEIEADDKPQKLRAEVFAEASEHASDTAMRVAELDPGLKAPLAVELPAGVYTMRITGQWGVGDHAYNFRLKSEIDRTGMVPPSSGIKPIYSAAAWTRKASWMIPL